MNTLVLPFIHIVDKKNSNVEATTAVNPLLQGEQRSCIERDERKPFNYGAQFTVSTVMTQAYHAFCYNTLHNIDASFFGSGAELYITHQFKKIGSVLRAVGDEIVAVYDDVVQYVEDTFQSLDNFKFGFIVDTDVTIHTYYIEARIRDHRSYAAFIEITNGVQITIPSECQYMLYVAYPINIVPAKVSYKYNRKEAHFDVELTSELTGTENKRAAM